jgi:hypothetical protein
MAVNVEQRGGLRDRSTKGRGVVARLTSETKNAFKTTEFYAMVVVIVGILVASALVGQGDGTAADATDAFPASRAWLYIAIVAVGYMVSRGLAKAGSSEPYWADSSDLPGGDDRD